MSYSEAFLGNFAEQLLSYGVGRMLDYRDMPMVRLVAREAAKNNNRFSSFVLGIVKNPLLQMSRTNNETQQ